MELNRGVVSSQILDAYHSASARLTELGVPHLVIGGLAVGAWGHPRATKDIDFLVRERDVFDGKLFLSFKPNIPIQHNGVAIDYLVVESLKTKSRFSVKNGEVVPLEVLFAMKLRAHRAQDEADVVALLQKGADATAIGHWLTKEGFDAEHARLLKLAKRAKKET